jgi:hypothetical protein
MTVDPYWWMDRNSSWWAKMDRAQAHLNDLTAEVRQFVGSGWYEVEQVPGAAAHETDLRLRISRPIPVYISTIIGDVLHNMRSALDCVAFELASRYVAPRELTEDEQVKCEFPIRDELAKVNTFFQESTRRTLYGPREQRAMRDVQPGWLHDQLVAMGGTPARPRADEVPWDSLTLLQRLSNVDKHRTLHLVGWWPDLVYWGSNEGDPEYRWRWGRPPFEDGSVLGTLIGDPGQPAPTPELQHEMELRLFEPPEVRSSDVVGLLTSIHGHLSNWVIPRVINPYWLGPDGLTDQERGGPAPSTGP